MTEYVVKTRRNSRATVQLSDRKRTVLCGSFAGISPVFRCSVVTNATSAPRAVLVRSVTYESAKNLSKICKPMDGRRRSETRRIPVSCGKPPNRKALVVRRPAELAGSWSKAWSVGPQWRKSSSQVTRGCRRTRSPRSRRSLSKGRRVARLSTSGGFFTVDLDC